MYLSAVSPADASTWHSFAGAFANSQNDTGSSASAFVSSGGHGDVVINLDASLSNPIYGNSDTVQPPAVSTIYAIKY